MSTVIQLLHKQLGPKELIGPVSNHDTSTSRLPSLVQVSLGDLGRSETNRDTTGNNVLACSV